MPLKISGIPQIKIMLTELDSKNDAYVADVLATIGKRMLELIKYNSPVFTGEYQKAWKVLGKKKKSITIGLPNDPQLQLIFGIKEFTGIKKDFILPKSKKVLHWKDPVDGEDVFAMYVVVTPQMRNPHPHLRPAIKQIKKEMRAIMYIIAKKHFRIAKFALKESNITPQNPMGKNPFGRK